MEGLLPQFVRSFTKAVRREMEAMRRALGPFEVPLADPEPVVIDETGRHVARYRLLEPNDKLVPAMECSLRSEEGEALVTVVGLERLSVRLACDRPLPSRGDPLSLVILIADLPYFRARAAGSPIGRLLETVAAGGRVVPASEAVSEGVSILQTPSDRGTGDDSSRFDYRIPRVQ